MRDTRNPNLGILALVEPASERQGDDWRRNLDRSSIDLSSPRGDDWWTGKRPVSGECPGVGEDGKIRSLDMPDLSRASRQEVRDYFDNGWTLSEVLFSGLVSDEAFYRPPYHDLRHPLVFYYVHTAALYVNKLRVAGLIDQPIDPYIERLFETGVDEMSWDDMSKNSIEWPAMDVLHAYRARVYETVTGVIESHKGLAESHEPITMDSPLWALFMGFEHERIHLETSSVLIRELPLQLVSRPKWFPAPHGMGAARTGDETTNESAAPHGLEVIKELPPRAGVDYPANSFIEVTEPGEFTVGKPFDYPTYGWDNEYGQRKSSTGAFSATRHLITNGEYWHFVAAGGYHQKRYWTEDGWRWRSFRNVKWPTFWYASGPAGANQYVLRTIYETIPMPWSWPVAVNFHEARAYAAWKSEQDNASVSYRMLTEGEHHRLRQLVEKEGYGRGRLSPGDSGYVFEGVYPSPANLNLRFGSETPVDLDSGLNGKSGGDGKESSLPTDLFGNLWQWMEDHFHPLDGFKIHPYYDDFSTPCFDGEHQMILGGSFISTGDEATRFARFHFRPHFFQHAGFRLAYSPDGSNGNAVILDGEDATQQGISKEEVLERQLVLHYGPSDVQAPFNRISAEFVHFPQRCVELLVASHASEDGAFGKALEVGCSVGAASFALAKHFDEVTGTDIRENLIDWAKRIKQTGDVFINYREEGEIYASTTCRVDEASRKKVQFRRADPCSLPADYLDFDAVLLSNVLTTVPSPMSLVGRLGGNRGLVREGGLLMVVSDFDWKESATPRELWLGGRKSDGEECFSEEGLRNALGDEFQLMRREELPYLIREHRRKYQLGMALATVWRRVR